MKRCTWCGGELEESEFRPYYNGNGTYPFCRSCERIEGRRRYLLRKSKTNNGLKVNEEEELEQINKLYAARKKAGLRVPGERRVDGTRIPTKQLVDSQLQQIEESAGQ